MQQSRRPTYTYLYVKTLNNS